MHSSVKHGQLEPIVWGILQHIGVNISGGKIEACHRLGKNNDRTIAKFSVSTERVSKKIQKILMLLTWTFQEGQSSILMTVEHEPVEQETVTL